MLPGLLFSAFKPWFSGATNTGLGMVPSDLLTRHPELAYAAHTQLKGPGRTLQMGPQVVLLNVTAYSNWNEFREDCYQVATAIQKTGLLGSPERFSLKYVNLIEHRADEPLSAVRVRVDTPGFNLSGNGFRLRFETTVGPTLNIVECASGATSTATPLRSGLMFAIDTIRTSDLGRFWDRLPDLLDESHSVLESVFFGLVSDSSLATFEPIWE